jgi:hypothetical protein
MTATGWTPNQVDLAPWPAILELMSYWKHHPPVHVLVRSFFKEEGKQRVIENADEDQLAQGIAGLTF